MNTLRGMVEQATKDLPVLIENVRHRKTKNTPFSYYFLSSRHQILALGEKYINGNDDGYRQHMHVASKLIVESIRIHDYQRMGTGGELWDALMSDSPEVINTMARFEPAYYTQHRHDPLSNYFFVHMWQLAIQGDDHALAIKIHRLAKNGRKPWRKRCADGQDFFSLLLCGDKAGLEHRIEEDAKLPNDDPITGGFFAFLATFEAKLCWYRGIKVDIANPQVPMDLMPIRPLARYDDVYDFLAPGWTPPRKGLLGGIQRFLKM